MTTQTILKLALAAAFAAQTNSLSFEVASIRPNGSGSTSMQIHS